MKSLLILFSIFASAHEAGETRAQIGPGQAVESYDEHDGIKLSAKAIKALNIKTLASPMATRTAVPKSALLAVKEDKAVYVLRDGLFKFIPVTVESTQGETLKVASPDLKDGDQIVVSGLALLRVTHLNLVGSGKEEHDDHGDGEEHKAEEHENHRHEDGEHHD
jgi:hypothetical protein